MDELTLLGVQKIQGACAFRLNRAGRSLVGEISQIEELLKNKDLPPQLRSELELALEIMEKTKSTLHVAAEDLSKRRGAIPLFLVRT
jgi:hypothetical protein